MQVQVLGAIERVKYAAYGLLAGILIGMVLGWLFHGVVRTILWELLVIVILVPFVAAVIFWQRISGRNRLEKTSRDTVVVHEGRRIRDAGTVDDSDAVRDAEWHERS